jgi:hypothetical protein
MNVWSVNFRELYERHLCRHSQFGINVIHLAAVVGTYLALYGILFGLVQGLGHVLASAGLAYGLLESKWVLVPITVPYLVILAVNIPVRLFLATVMFLGLFFVAFVALPQLPIWAIWAYLVGIVVFYKIQAWSHQIYNKEKDMTEFNKKYEKGFHLFILLSIYELPILLCYLVFGQRDWCA